MRPSASSTSASRASSSATTRETNGFTHTGSVQAHEVVVRAPHQLGIAREVAAPVHTDHAVVLHHHMIGRRTEVRATRGADHEDASFPSNAVPRAFEGVAADRIEDDVGAQPTGGVVHGDDEVIGAMVDRDGRLPTRGSARPWPPHRPW